MTIIGIMLRQDARFGWLDLFPMCCILTTWPTQADDIFVHFFRPARDGLNITRNTLVGTGTDIASLEAMGNSIFATRAAAGLGPYPSLPSPKLPASASDVACADALERICGVARAFQQCEICCGQHQHDLRQAGCTAGHCASFCSTTR